jgi:hypothetical protein
VALLEGFPVGFCEDAHDLGLEWVILVIEACDAVYIMYDSPVACSPLRQRMFPGGWMAKVGKALSETNDFHSLRHQDQPHFNSSRNACISHCLAVQSSMKPVVS